MSNTEKLVVYKHPTRKGLYYNHNLDFEGTATEAKEYAQRHNFGGGVELFICLYRGKPIFDKLN